MEEDHFRRKGCTEKQNLKNSLPGKIFRLTGALSSPTKSWYGSLIGSVNCQLKAAM
jgi:hypothetical protein